MQVMFSRAVVSLGSTFGSPDLPEMMQPFQVLYAPSGQPVTGKSRWVSTSIYRWDPQPHWKLNNKIRIEWNSNLTSYDGAHYAQAATLSSSTQTQPVL
jgi:hypothetical protein